MNSTQAQTPASVRPFAAADTAGVTELLHELPLLYPGADAWLARRLRDCAAGRAWAWVATAAGRVCGVIIVVAKEGRLKLANVFVAPGWRGRGVGSCLVAQASSLWTAPEREVYVTVAPENLAGVGQLLAPHGFREQTTVVDRYGPGRDEVVLIRGPRPSHAG